MESARVSLHTSIPRPTHAMMLSGPDSQIPLSKYKKKMKQLSKDPFKNLLWLC